MYDKELIVKIQDILSYLIDRMQKRTDLFTAHDIKGLEIGLEMLTKGEEVLNTLSDVDQDVLIQFILQVEKDIIEELFA